MSETQTEEQEEYKGVVLYGKYLYAFIGVCLFVLSTVSYNAYSSHQEARKVNTQLTQQQASTGAKIDTILKNIENNKRKWTEQDKIAKEAYIIANKAELTQQAINDNTDKQKAELEKLNISLIK